LETPLKGKFDPIINVTSDELMFVLLSR